MSTYDDASLVLVPSGYKNGIVFSQKPMDANGQLTFTRASSATRVQSDGLIEKVRTNLALQSNTFSNATWVKGTAGTGVSVTSGQSGYDGTSDAWLLAKNLANEALSQSISFSGLATFSVYAKAGTTDWVRIGVGGGTFSSAYFDLTNAVVGATTTNIVSASIVAVSSGWYRCSIVTNKATNAIFIYPAEGDNDTSGTSGNILIQAAQLETGDIATDYIATTTAAVSVGPVSGLPRLDYLNSTCPRLLLEPQRTNACLWSEQIDNAGWTKLNATITANATTSPDGYVNADKIVASAANDVHRASQSFNVSSGNVYATSCYLKASEYSFAALQTGTSGGAGLSSRSVIVNLTNGTIVSETIAGSAYVENAENGWYRVILRTAQTTGSGAPGFIIVPLITNNLDDYAGDGTSGIYAWGAQIEAGAYASSYIPTLSASVTRVADACSKTGISSLIGQTEGTLYWEGVRPEGGTDISAFSISDGTTNNEVTFRFTAADTIEFYVRSGGGQTVSGSYTGADLNQNTKIAFAYKANDAAAYVNGTLVVADNTVTVPTSLTALKFARGNDATPMVASVNQALLFKTRLDNATLQSLTTL
jgi:hypothetical protein